MVRVRGLNVWGGVGICLVMLPLLSIGGSAAVGKTIRVRVGGTGDGSSWANAYGDLQTALDDADPNDDIWVAEGMYRPTSDYGLGMGDRGKHFRMKNGVGVYGGFPAVGDPNWQYRDWEDYETVLSGDLLGNDVEIDDPWDLVDDPCRADNCYTIFYHPAGTYLDPNAVLDGFSITGGSMTFDDRFWFGGGMYNDESSPTVSNCKFIGNSAYQGGGMANSFSNPKVTNCMFTGNSAEWRGGGMYNDYSNPIIANCTFNSACPGGAMVNWQSWPVVTDCNFIGNRTVIGGGIGMHNQWSSPTVTNCTFSDNSAYLGGGMCNIGGNPTVTNCYFIGNSAEYDGGGMCNIGGSSTVTNCYFIGNRTEAADGGGMSNDYSSPTVTNCSFIGNRTEAGHGGGMSNYWSNPNVTDCSFTGNRTVIGSGGGMHNDSSNSTVANCTFSGNSAGDEGGGMFNNDSDPIVSDSTFRGNRANDGAGMYNYGRRPTVTNCAFCGNSAENEGGGMHNNDGEQTILGCLFSGNSAGAGGGTYNLWCTTNLTDCTFNGNAAEFGAAVYVDEGFTNASNCILWNGPGGYYEYDGWGTVSYSNVQGGWSGVGNIDTDPCFADPGYRDPNGTQEDPNDDFWVDGDYHLKSQAGRWDPNIGGWVIDDVTSPCIDAGYPLAPIGPEPFPNGGVVNMGAYGRTSEASKSYFGKPPCETIIAGDVNGDCQIDFIDLRLMGLRWCEQSNPMPEEAWGPTPEDGASMVMDTTLSWNLGALDTGGYTVSYIVYLGTDENDLAALDTVLQTSYDVSLLNYSTRYYWRIDTKRSLTVPPFTAVITPGNIWSFTTDHPIPTGHSHSFMTEP